MPRLITTNFHDTEFLVSRDHPELLQNYQMTEQQRQNIFLLCMFGLEPLRAGVGGQIHVTSGVRTVELNRLLQGSSSTSQHLLGEACDFHHADLEACWRYIITDMEWPGQVRLYKDRFIHFALPRYNVIPSHVIIDDGETIKV